MFLFVTFSIVGKEKRFLPCGGTIMRRHCYHRKQNYDEHRNMEVAIKERSLSPAVGQVELLMMMLKRIIMTGHVRIAKLLPGIDGCIWQ